MSLWNDEIPQKCDHKLEKVNLKRFLKYAILFKILRSMHQKKKKRKEKKIIKKDAEELKRMPNNTKYVKQKNLN